MIKDSLAKLRTLARQRQYDMLEKTCLAEIPPVSAEVYPLLAIAQAHLGKYQAARETVAQIQETDIQSKLSFNGCLDLAGAYLVLLQLDGAGTLLDRLLEEQPDHPLVLARYGWYLIAAGKPDVAQDYFLKSVNQDPSLIPAWTNLAALALDRDDIDVALDAIEKGRAALAKTKDLPENHAKASFFRFDQLFLECRVKQKAFARAEAWLDDIRIENKEEVYTPRLIAYSTALAAQDLHSQAEDALCQGLKHYPNNISLLMQQAQLAEIQGHFI
ncbi:MAG: hypothetical protein GY860_10950, partial [Desulfobacteraceae bacterium]|nr:hypothetical protein [Desulfobacteraceae bacterium]